MCFQVCTLQKFHVSTDFGHEKTEFVVHEHDSEVPIAFYLTLLDPAGLAVYFQKPMLIQDDRVL